MSRPRKSDGVAPQQRRNLSRKRKRLELVLEDPDYAKLVELSTRDARDRPKALVQVVARLIRAA